MTFQPNVDDALIINKIEFRFTEHPSAKSMPYGQTGRRATVYQVKAHDGTLYALKVFTQAFRSPRHAENADRLRPFSSLPGLEVCRRTVITPQDEKKLVGEHPDLTYAVLMPWVNGETWQELMLAQHTLTPQQSLELARSLASILANMEQKGIAHCDLSGPNVMLSFFAPSGISQGERIALVDVDDLYASGLPRPEKLPGGSPGYAHKTAPQGLWSAETDRFAGAILLVEMLAWCDQRVRQGAFGEQYFDPAEVQKDSKRYRLLSTVLRERYSTPLAESFSQAWQSETLNDCPPLSKWAELLGASQTPVVTEVAAPEAGFVLPTFKPEFRPLDEVAPSPEVPLLTPLSAPNSMTAPPPSLVMNGEDSTELDEYSDAMLTPVTREAKSSSVRWVWVLVVLLVIALIILFANYSSQAEDLQSIQWALSDARNEQATAVADARNEQATVQAQESQITDLQTLLKSLRPHSFKVSVYANQDWQKTNMYLYPGDKVYVDISGTWCAWSGACDFPDVLAAENGGILDPPLGGLIGKIGDGTPFHLRDLSTTEINQSGYLYLRINDPDVGDNSGSIIVQIEIR